MKHFILNTQLLHKKIQFLAKKFTKIQINPTTLSSANITTTMPPFTSASLTTSYKNLLNIIEARNFEIENGTVTFRNYCCGIAITKTIELDLSPEIDYMKSNARLHEMVRIEVPRDICELIGKVRCADVVNVSWFEGLVRFCYNDGIKVQVIFEGDEFESFFIRSKDLWFMQYNFESVFMCVEKCFVVFYLYEEESETTVKVDMITP